MQDSLKVKFAAALLEQVLKTLAKQIHHHNVVHLAVLRLLVSHEVQEGHEGLAPQLVNELAFPEQHDVTLHLNCFLLQPQ